MMRTGTPDPTGMAAAMAAQEANRGNTVILFGSRARGDHRPDSDVDILIVCQDSTIAAESRARAAIRKYFQQNPPRLGVDIVTFTDEKFSQSRRAPNHVAGQAVRDGVVMSGERLDYGSDYEDEYPASWPDVKMRLQAAHRNLRAFNLNFQELPEDQETWGFHAQQAVENSLKAWVSASGLEYRRIHEMEEPAEKLFADPVESGTLAAQQLRMLINMTTCHDPAHPDDHLNWLDKYGVLYKYNGTAHRMGEEEERHFRQEILLAVHTFMNRAFELTGTTEEDL